MSNISNGWHCTAWLSKENEMYLQPLVTSIFLTSTMTNTYMCTIIPPFKHLETRALSELNIGNPKL